MLFPYSIAGLYLYMLVVETFSGSNAKFKMYAFIGWGMKSVSILLYFNVPIFSRPHTHTHTPHSDLSFVTILAYQHYLLISQKVTFHRLNYDFHIFPYTR